MGESVVLADWRVRALAQAGACALCAAFCALLVLASRVALTPERAVSGVEVFFERPPEHELARPPQARPARPGASAPMPALSTAPSADAAMQAQLLRCFVRPGQPRPPNCPSDPPPEDWRRPQLPMGGEYAPPPEPDMDAIYTRAERDTLVMPSCIRDKTSGACMRFGQRPPPPSRSAEQICRDGGLGGPCVPPPEQVD